MIYKKILAGLFFVCTILLSGCQSPALFHQSEENIADVTQRLQGARQKSDIDAKRNTALLIDQGMYVDRTPISLTKQPTWLRNHIIIRGDQLPFSYYSRTVVGGGGKNILTQYQVGLDPSASLSMNYSGNVKGALDLIAAKTGYVYSVNGNSVYWQAFVTKTFDIAFMPGSSDYMMGKGSNTISGTSTLTAGSGGGTVVAGLIDDSAASQYSNLKGTLSIWNDLKNTIQQMLSPDGKVMVSEATTSVTVRDKPTNVELVGKYVENLNHNLSKQVLVKIQVLEITLSSSFNYGIDWQAVIGNVTKFMLNANNQDPIGFTTNKALVLGADSPITMSGAYNKGHSSFSALLNALKQQGKVSIVTEPRVVCLNNQVSVVRIVQQEGYLASIQNTTVAGASGGGSAGTITSSITPGTLITGLTLYVLPKILGDKIFLQVNADLSTNQGFTTSSTTKDPNSPSAQVITNPNVVQKQFNQRTVIASGDTLILSGFRQVSNKANAAQFFDSQALGGQGAIQTNVETIVLLTPIILGGL